MNLCDDDNISYMQGCLIVFLPSYDFVCTTVWLHHFDSDKMLGKKARGQLLKNTMSCFTPLQRCSPGQLGW